MQKAVYTQLLTHSIDNQDEYTRSDLQGIVTVLVNKIMQQGHEILSESEQE